MKRHGDDASFAPNQAFRIYDNIIMKRSTLYGMKYNTEQFRGLSIN